MYDRIEYYDNGSIKAEGFEVDGHKEGKWIYYYENGKKQMEINYKKGIKDGIFVRWFENGKIAIESSYKDGKDIGTWKEYYENGEIKEIGEFINSEYIPKDFWDENGKQLLKDGTGKKIEKFGYLGLDVYEFYLENGKLIKEVKISSADYRGFIEGKHQDE